MATTRLSDIVNRQLFVADVQQEIPSLSRVLRSRIVDPDPQFATYAADLSATVTMPVWPALTGRSNVGSDDPTQEATPLKRSSAPEVTRKHFRTQGWQTTTVTDLHAGSVLARTQAQVAEYWVNDIQGTLTRMLTGIFGSASMAANELDVASEDGVGSPVLLTPSLVAQGKALMGDRVSGLGGIMMHTTVLQNLEADQAITYIEAGIDPAGNRVMVPQYMGLDVIASMDLQTEAGATSGTKYDSYLIGTGAVAYGDATASLGDRALAFDTVESAGNGGGVETMWSRRLYLLHVRGVSQSGTPAAGTYFSDAELIVGANYTRVYDPDLIPIVRLTTNG